MALDRPVRTILVTSASPGEGKTTTVVNLAIMMAQVEARVLMVDANFRRPSLQDLCGLVPRGKARVAGLSDVIAGRATLAEVTVPSGFARVGLIPSGIVPRHPNELLGSLRMKAVLGDLPAEADLVLIDSPACRVWSDALVLAPLTDGVVYVVRSGAHDWETQRRVQRQLDHARARMLGVVFNGAEAGHSSVYYATSSARRWSSPGPS